MNAYPYTVVEYDPRSGAWLWEESYSTLQDALLEAIEVAEANESRVELHVNGVGIFDEDDCRMLFDLLEN